MLQGFCLCGQRQKHTGAEVPRVPMWYPRCSYRHKSSRHLFQGGCHYHYCLHQWAYLLLWNKLSGFNQSGYYREREEKNPAETVILSYFYYLRRWCLCMLCKTNSKEKSSMIRLLLSLGSSVRAERRKRGQRFDESQVIERVQCFLKSVCRYGVVCIGQLDLCEINEITLDTARIDLAIAILNAMSFVLYGHENTESDRCSVQLPACGSS